MNCISAFTAALVAGLLVLVGCAPGASESGSAQDTIPVQSCQLPAAAPLAVAVGARANVPKPMLPAQVQDLMQAVGASHKQLTLIRLDGAPSIIFDDPPPSRSGNRTADKQVVADYLSDARQAFATHITAVTAQADVLAALSLGGRATVDGGTIVLVDSGLQTVAPLDFAHGGLLEARPAEVATYLAETKLLPDLKGRNVLLVGFGNTAEPQPALDNNLRAKVVQIWKAIAEASGACVAVLEQGNTKQSVVTSPEVAAVTPPPPPDPRFCGTVELGERENIAFEPDTATFRDPQAAQESLRDFANAMREGSRRAQLVGTTATDGTAAGRRALSARRAEAVKTVLVELGVPAELITTKGVGTDWPGHVPDIGPDGRLLPGPAGQNRKVILIITCAH